MEREDVVISLTLAPDVDEANIIIEEELGCASIEEKIEYILELFNDDIMLSGIVRNNEGEPKEIVYDELLNAVILF